MAKFANVSSSPAAQGPTAPSRHQPRSIAGALTFAGLATILVLSQSGCGGGGGSNLADNNLPPTNPAPPPIGGTPVSPPPAPAPAPPPPPAPFGTLSATGCTIVVDGAACNATVSFTTNVANPTLVVEGNGAQSQTIPLSGTSGTVSVTLSGAPGERRYALRSGSSSTPVATAVSQSACTSGSAWDAEHTKQCFPLLCYSEKLTVIRDTIINATSGVKNGVPFSITRVKQADGTTLRWEHAEVKNQTGIADNWSQTGFTQRYFNCAIGPVDRFGRAMRACRVQDDAASGVQWLDWWELFYVNHVTDTFHRLPGRLPGFPDGYKLSLPFRDVLDWTAENGRIFYGSDNGFHPTPLLLLFQSNAPGASPEQVMRTAMGPEGGNTISTPVIERNSCGS